jgi:hypothetical protein
MQRLDLVWQARAYVSEAKQTINARKKLRLLRMAERLLAMSAAGSDKISLVCPSVPQFWLRKVGEAS